ncbi:MAG: DMT family transporter [Jatrophihabitans sp.]|nr:MAG: DMT family transporter [Jatrophihabitans sp.]
MVTVVLGLLAAVSYGLADFAGGVASRRHSAVTVLLYSYPVGAVLMLALLPLFPGSPDGRVVLFGVLGGAAGLFGVIVLYGLMVVAPMNVISPVTAVLSAIVPVVFAVLTGERPTVAAGVGIAVGVVAVLLVSRTSEDHPHGRIGAGVLGLALLAGVGFGAYFIFLARAGNHSGLWPLVISRWTSALLIVPVAVRRRRVAPVGGRMLALVVGSGTCDALANMFFLLASRAGLLSLASVLTSLYPAVTVLLAVLILREHTSRVQRLGLALAGAAIVLITV